MLLSIKFKNSSPSKNIFSLKSESLYLTKYWNNYLDELFIKMGEAEITKKEAMTVAKTRTILIILTLV
jgi:hypothetical protein